MRTSSCWIPSLPVLSATLLLCGAPPALAQVRSVTFDELRREVSPGDVVSVVQTTGDRVKGRLIRFGDVDVDVREEARESGRPKRVMDLTIPRSAILSIERPRDSSRNGMLIGAGVGLGFALAMVAYAVAVDRNEMDEWAAGYVLGGAVVTGVGALTGWAIDAAHSKPHVRYVAEPRQTMTIGVGPLRSGNPGVALVVSF